MKFCVDIYPKTLYSYKMQNDLYSRFSIDMSELSIAGLSARLIFLKELKRTLECSHPDFINLAIL